MIVAKNGYNVNSDKRYLSIDSDISNLMVIDELSFNGSETGYNHGLGYLPATLEFYNYGTQWFPMGTPATIDLAGNFIGIEAPQIEYDLNDIYITQYDSVPFKLFIFGNSADNQIGSGKSTAVGKLKIAKNGLNVPYITDIRQFQFCSGLDTIKKDIELSGSFTLSCTGTIVTHEINHNLGYVPMVMARLVNNTGDTSLNGSTLPINQSFFDVTPISFYITSQKIVFYIYGDTTTATINYNLYRNKLN